MSTPHREVKARLAALYDELIAHPGYAGFTVEIRILRKGQKEVIVDCGKQYRYVVDYRPVAPMDASTGAADGDDEAPRASAGSLSSSMPMEEAP